MTPVDRREVVDPGVDTSDALRRLLRRNDNPLPVLDHDHVAGMVWRGDILRSVELQSGHAL